MKGTYNLYNCFTTCFDLKLFQRGNLGPGEWNTAMDTPLWKSLNSQDTGWNPNHHSGFSRFREVT